MLTSFLDFTSVSMQMFHHRSNKQSQRRQHQLSNPLSGSFSCLGPDCLFVVWWCNDSRLSHQCPPISPFFCPHFSQLRQSNREGHVGKGWGGACLGGRRDSLMQSDAWRKVPSRKWHGGGEVSAPWGGTGRIPFRSPQRRLPEPPRLRVEWRRRRWRLASATSIRLGQCDSAPASLCLSLSRLFRRHRDCHYSSLRRVRASDVDADSSRMTDDVEKFLRKFLRGQ